MRCTAALFLSLVMVATCKTNPDISGGGGGSTGGGAAGDNGSGTGGSAGFSGVVYDLPDAATPTGGIKQDAAVSCGQQDFKLDRSPVDVVLVLDVSGSLNEPIDKWNAVAPAVRQVVQTTQKDLDWGVKAFPVKKGGGNCVVSPTIDVPVAQNNYPAIDALITANTPPDGDGTPTGDAIDVAVAYLKSLNSTKPQYLMLATDGEPSCPYKGQPDTNKMAHVDAVTAAAAAGIPTYVIGVADNTKSSGVLTAMAMAGGRARPVDPLLGGDMFYQAASQTELVKAMQIIAGQMASCVFGLTEAPRSPDDVAADILIKDDPNNKVRVPRDGSHTAGWEYTGADKMAIEFFGTYCDMVRDLDAQGNRVKFTFGCPGIPIL